MMRNYQEPSARNLLRKPLVMGVPLMGLIFLSFVVLSINLLGGTGKVASTATIIVASVGYAVLRAFTRWAKSGWEESMVFELECRLPKKAQSPQTESFIDVEVYLPDTLDDDGLMGSKEAMADLLREIPSGEDRIFIGKRTVAGFELVLRKSGPVVDFDKYPHILSLHQLPVKTHPLWLTQTLNRTSGDLMVLVRVTSLDFWKSKARIETARRSNARDTSRISNIDSEVSFEEASRVLEGLSRGEERIYEASLVILSAEKLSLEPEFFTEEKRRDLPILAITGQRRRFHRSFFIREVTLCDLIPNLMDPVEAGTPVLATRRGHPLYFSPLDTRLEALHWLVVGASGSGKSFFTGLMLKRLIEQGEQISVLFVDHNRSFRRLVRLKEGPYLEPTSFGDLEIRAPHAIGYLNMPGNVAGIELSDLSIGEKKLAAHAVLGEIERFLRERDSTHPIFVVLDECWNFMRDEPVLVQRAFREFRKLNGAAVAITQSLADFLTDEAGQSIYQNAPVRILLRQGEDVSRYQGILGLNSREISIVKSLQQKKGVYSECLIKTPFLSRVGRLHPTESEYSLLRTDNLREEMVRKSKIATKEGTLCV